MKKTDSPIRIGIIGCGWAASAHGRGYSQLPDLFNVAVVCDPDETAAGSLGRDLSADAVETDWQRVVDEPEVDAVDICLPHHLHHPVAVAAARVGKHVLTEKPLARTVEEGREMVRAAEEADVHLMVAFNERFNWHIRTMKRIVDEGRIGKVYMVRTDHNQNVRFAEKAWFKSREFAGGGALIGSGVHMLDLLRWFGGEASEVFCTTHYMPDRLEGEVAAGVVVTYRDGGIGTLDIMWAAQAEPWYQFLVVYGSEGRATTLGGDITVATSSGVETIAVPDDAPDCFAEEIGHFGNCCVSGETPLTVGSDALKTQEIVAAAYQSAESRSAVRL